MSPPTVVTVAVVTSKFPPIQFMSAGAREAIKKRVEDKANGTAVMEALRATVPGLEAVEPLGGKVVGFRIAGQVLLAGLLLSVFGRRGVPVPVLVAAAVALWGGIGMGLVAVPYLSAVVGRRRA